MVQPGFRSGRGPDDPQSIKAMAYQVEFVFWKIPSENTGLKRAFQRDVECESGRWELAPILPDPALPGPYGG
jgi:hypothetical protein